MEETASPRLTLPDPAKWWARGYIWQLIIAGALLIACVLVLVLMTGNVGGWRRAKATVVMPDQYTYYITYDTSMGAYTHVEKRNVPIRDIKDGQTLYFRYRTDSPSTVVPYTDAMVLGILLGVAGLILTAISASMWREDNKRRARWDRVRREGVPVRARVLSVFNDYLGLTARARKRFSRLDCVYYPEADSASQQESGEADVWLFTSERFLTPEYQFGGNVTVYVIPSAPDDYYVDLTTLEVEITQSTTQDIPSESI